uniref:ATP synthase F0 subunit 8 n=1 Tax=Vespa affinis TaxID=882735 RepID=A0A0U2DVT7_VESAF|nr:ATP synthase F0 subunit 8 [Vespa affinis]
MPQLSPMKWFNLYLIIMLMMITIIIKMNFFFLNKPESTMKKMNNHITQLKWKI